MSNCSNVPRGRIGVGPAILAAFALATAAGCHSLKMNAPVADKADVKADGTVPAAPAAPSKFSFRVAPYVFISDFEAPREQPLFQELASMRDQIDKELQLPPGNAVIQVYLFEDRDRYEHFMQARYPDLPLRRAFFVAQPRTIGGAEDLLVYTFWGERIQQDLRHELTHALLHSVMRDVPLWLDEGLAEYFELPPDRQGLNSAHLDSLRRGPLGPYKPDLARLEGLTKVEQMSPAEYRESWAWVHLMLRDKPEAKTVLTSYLHQLRLNNSPGPLEPKLAAVFPSPDDALDLHLARLEATTRADGATVEGESRMGQFDQAARYAAKIDPPAFLRWLLLRLDAALTFQGWLDTRTLPFPGEPDRTCDTVAELLDAAHLGRLWALIVEFQSEPDPEILDRLLEYMVRLRREIRHGPDRREPYWTAGVLLNLTGLARTDLLDMG